MIRFLLLLSLVAPGAAAMTLDLPETARETGASRGTGRVALPAGPWREDGVERLVSEGRIVRRAWSLGGRTLTVDQIAEPLHAQLREADYDILLNCQAEICGGYDFRFAVRTLPAPAMFVDLGDYRYILARAPEGGAVLSLLVSRAGSIGYVQLTTVSDAPGEAVEASPAAEAAEPSARTGGVWDRLEAVGHAALDDLSFGTGSSALADGSFPSLSALAAGLEARRTARVALVGHTDTSGPLDANIALSRRRAQSGRTELIDRYGTDPAQLVARGVGYLSPRGSNASPEGRTANRRVEVVLIE
jgi:outer membrane protein OmpA-like peptidoglycan-associated protein